MISAEQTAALLLCAGTSERYGRDDKLMALLDGEPLVAHAAKTLAAIPFRWRIAVVTDDESITQMTRLLRNYGFDLVTNACPEAGKGHSLRMGLQHALDRGAPAILLCLGDMPHVTAGHLTKLLDAAGDHGAISSSGGWKSPPAVFPAHTAEQLMAEPHLKGHEALTKAAIVHATPRMLSDYDTPVDFARSADLLGQP